ncbi:PucR family transcriptional regulator ligand-binding domain-containing protein [Nocardioides sp. InS609-2]|uniref:helix-turn-helix domain-containing protein n=1 Tax=Nocardioides sp. InS609-2 TaxID=2760705 RepID=UPI0020BFC3F7|nr:PucR family transcriptional regulator ligand-binding domain-containing protein [Nocardioides sp. InS609-2]
MLIPLAEILTLPAVAAGAPLVLHGTPEDCLIRWVHSSEVFEMGPLLRGQELLLTTGLGLKGSSPSDLEGYIDALADAGLAALALELGRTFAEVPAAVTRAAKRRNLPLLAFRGVVPFESVVEGFHELVMHRDRATLRVSDRVWRELLDVVLAGDGLNALVKRVAHLANARCVLLARDGRVVAASDPGATQDSPTAANSRTVDLGGTAWGSLVIAGSTSQTHTAILDRAVKVVSLELLRTGTTLETAAVANNLLRDIADSRLPSVEELRSRLEIAGFPAEKGRPIVALCVASDRRISPPVLSAAAHRASRETFGACLVGHLDDDVVIVARVPRGSEQRLREALGKMCSSLSETIEQTTGHAIVTVAAGSPVGDVDGLTATLTQSREVASIARRLGARRQPLHARDLGIYRLLARFGNEPELADFLREQIGPLLDHDATYSSKLVQTLDTYLQHGLAKTETATALGIRRQTLYNRLDRINAVLGRDALTAHESRTALSLALHAWRLRTGLDPSRSGG